MIKAWHWHIFSWQSSSFLLHVWTLIYYGWVPGPFCSLPFGFVYTCIFFFYLTTEKLHMHLVSIHPPVCTLRTNYIHQDTPIYCKLWTYARGCSWTNCSGCCWSECSVHSYSFSVWDRSFPQMHWLNCLFTKQDSVAFWDFKNKKRKVVPVIPTEVLTRFKTSVHLSFYTG